MNLTFPPLGNVLIHSKTTAPVKVPSDDSDKMNENKKSLALYSKYLKELSDVRIQTIRCQYCLSDNPIWTFLALYTC